jgi:DNA-binding transcriptional ArsR family regulator
MKGVNHMSFAETFKALSDPVRREILQLLKAGPMSAGDIASHFDMTGATVSYHLKMLKTADLIWEKKEKNFIFYELNTSVLEDIMVWIADLKGDSSNDQKES